ncbi:hypothetical protein RND81_06G239800 [Saponaria officinalis]|uniref:MBD domain-containing protein n=1 Tax=Saponaria officinalis TaxID=3572 RepID=A0AAW1KAT0_SAPOF
MVSKNQPNWLPSDWKLQIKLKSSRKFKCYVHTKTNQKFYSRLAVLRYLKKGSVANDHSDATRKHAAMISQEQEVQLGVADDSLKGLPAGWTVEEKIRQSGTRKGTPYKCFTDPTSGIKFYSKPEVYRHLQLQSTQNRAGVSGREERRATRHSSSNRPVDKSRALEFDVEPRVSTRSSKAIASARLSSGKEELNMSENSKITASDRLSSGKKEPNVSQNSNTTSSRRLSSRKKEPNASENSKTMVTTRQSSGKKESNVSQNQKTNPHRKPSPERKEPNVSQNPKTTGTTPSRRLSSGEQKPNVSQNPKTTETTPSRRLSSGEQKPNVSQNPKTAETTPSRRLSSGEKKPNVSQNPKTTETTPSRRLSLGKKKVVVENTVDKDLPSGWIKEMRKRFRGTKAVRTDPFYFHPGSGIVFRSKREVLCYLDTGEISRHAYWRRNNVDREELATEKISPTPLVKSVSTTNSKKRKEIFAGEETSKGSPSSMSEEAAVKRITRSSSRVTPASVGEVKPDQSSLSPEVQDDNGKSRNLTPLAMELPSTPAMNISTAEKTVAVPLKSCSNKKAETTKRKSKDKNLLSSTSRSSKRLAGIDAQPVFHSIPIEHALRATKQSALDVPTAIVLETEEPQKNSDSLMQNAPPVFSETEAVFSETEVVDVPPMNTEQPPEKSTDHPIPNGKPDALTGSEIEMSMPGCPVVPEEEPSSIARKTEQSGSEFSFPPPLWSDPCLEFAYKTLTGAIPLDDNLAIEDYIQYQLHTSKQSNDFQSLPDIDMGSFPQNDETKMAPPLPEVMKLPNGNGLAPDNPSR